jgi:hypothetical protein
MRDDRDILANKGRKMVSSDVVSSSVLGLPGSARFAQLIGSSGDKDSDDATTPDRQC